MAAEAPADTFYASVQVRYFDGLDIKYPWFSFYGFSSEILKPGGSEFFTVFYLRVCNSNHQRPQFGVWRKIQQKPDPHHQNIILQRRRLTKTLLLVSLIALGSWLPTILYHLIAFLGYRISNNVFLMTCFAFYFNSFINPVVYALRIPDFKEALSLCCFTSHEAMSSNENSGRDDMAADLTVDHNNLQLTFEREIVKDTKL